MVRLNMSFQEAVDLFHLRYYPQEDPVRALRHQIEDVLYRVHTMDEEGWRWHINYAPTPRSQSAELLEYDFDAHWRSQDARSARDRISDTLPEVGLFLDLDCYRDDTDMGVMDWEDFVVRSQEKIEHVSQALFESFEVQEAR
jgi:hypothetical protein